MGWGEGGGDRSILGGKLRVGCHTVGNCRGTEMGRCGTGWCGCSMSRFAVAGRYTLDGWKECDEEVGISFLCCVMRENGAVCEVEWGQCLWDRWGLSGSSWPCCWECPVEEVAGYGVGRLIPCKAGVAWCPDDRDVDVFGEVL